MRRSKLEIIIDMLEVCKEETSITKLVYATNLNFKLARIYLGMLEKKGWVLRNGKAYRITHTGAGFLDRAKNLVLELIYK